MLLCFFQQVLSQFHKNIQQYVESLIFKCLCQYEKLQRQLFYKNWIIIDIMQYDLKSIINKITQDGLLLTRVQQNLAQNNFYPLSRCMLQKDKRSIFLKFILSYHIYKFFTQLELSYDVY
ncbi:hypothetical protein pb186bvf_014443 [Paramecium bursaria]